MNYKIYCVISKQALEKMGGIRGKMMAQAGHAYLHAYWDAEKRFPQDAQAYKDHPHAKKITLLAETDDEVLKILQAYQSVCGVTQVVDAGFTVFKEPTFTCIGIGPIEEKNVGLDLKKLKLLS